MQRKLALICVLLLVIIATATPKTSTAQAHTNCLANGTREVKQYRSETWKWQKQHDAKLTTSHHYERWIKSCSYMKWTVRLWQNRALTARHEFKLWFNQTYSKWNCIHQHEAGWNGDNNPTYDGGLQMDSEFQWTYGREFVRRWGQASNWPVWAQLLAAERAYKTRGFGPWPTRQYCGL